MVGGSRVPRGVHGRGLSIPPDTPWHDRNIRPCASFRSLGVRWSRLCSAPIRPRGDARRLHQVSHVPRCRRDEHQFACVAAGPQDTERHSARCRRLRGVGGKKGSKGRSANRRSPVAAVRRQTPGGRSARTPPSAGGCSLLAAHQREFPDTCVDGLGEGRASVRRLTVTPGRRASPPGRRRRSCRGCAGRRSGRRSGHARRRAAPGGGMWRGSAAARGSWRRCPGRWW